jgi:two-component system chemotaxis response regulator CheB
MLSADPEIVKVVARARAIVVGGSAGAVEALGAIAPPLPAGMRAPLIVVIHLPPTGPSLLVELFAPRCALAVREPLDKQAVLPGLWFAAPGYHLLLERRETFALSIDAPVHYSRPSVDVLFESAAEVYGEDLVAVVLTGASADGAAGARAVRDAGGAVLVQDPRTAPFQAMPEAAIAACRPQKVASAREIGRILRDAALAADGSGG